MTETKPVIDATTVRLKNDLTKGYQNAIKVFEKAITKVKNARNEEELIGIGIKLTEELQRVSK